MRESKSNLKVLDHHLLSFFLPFLFLTWFPILLWFVYSFLSHLSLNPLSSSSFHPFPVTVSDSIQFILSFPRIFSFRFLRSHVSMFRLLFQFNISLSLTQLNRTSCSPSFLLSLSASLCLIDRSNLWLEISTRREAE